ncbi:hypothetical protein WB44_03450 [Synechococcus sp. WH 8020]|nr:hypothetical protein WB44_03450 [Synechococcus sp. WH 8020]
MIEHEEPCESCITYFIEVKAFIGKILTLKGVTRRKDVDLVQNGRVIRTGPIRTIESIHGAD